MTSQSLGGLASIEGFPNEFRYRLRDDLSVTSAEQFVDLASRFPDEVASLLEISLDDLEQWRLLVADSMTKHRRKLGQADDDQGDATASQYPYMTGHDPPEPGRDTFGPSESEGRHRGERSEDGSDEVQ
jgi:hypothetical protein